MPEENEVNRTPGDSDNSPASKMRSGTGLSPKQGIVLYHIFRVTRILNRDAATPSDIITSINDVKSIEPHNVFGAGKSEKNLLGSIVQLAANLRWKNWRVGAPPYIRSEGRGYRINENDYVERAATAHVVMMFREATKAADHVDRKQFEKQCHTQMKLPLAFVTAIFDLLISAQYVVRSAIQPGCWEQGQRTRDEREYLSRVAACFRPEDPVAEVPHASESAARSEAPASGAAIPEDAVESGDLADTSDDQHRQDNRAALLATYAGLWHSYHMTMDSNGPFWSYSEVTLSEAGATEAKLRGRAVSFRDKLPAGLSQDEVKTYEDSDAYRVEAWRVGGHLVVQTARCKGEPDMAVKVFRNPSPPHLTVPMAGVTIITDTWAGCPATSMAIMSREKLSAPDVPALELAKNGEPIRDQSAMAVLASRWKSADREKIRCLVEFSASGFTPHLEADAPEATGWRRESLNALRRASPLHYYHVTVRKGKRFWLYSQLDFSNNVGSDFGPDFLHTEVCVTFNDGVQDQAYPLRAERIGEALIIRHDVTSPSDSLTHIAVFPFFAGSYNKDFAHGMAYHENYSYRSEYIPCLISDKPLLDIPVGQVPPELEDRLELRWNDRISETPINAKNLVCRYRGNDLDACKYTSSQHHILRRIRDTHVYAEDGAVFADPETYEVLKTGLIEFFKNPAARLNLIVGHRVDPKYIQLLIEAASSAAECLGRRTAQIEAQIRCRRVKNATTPMTNFLILDYIDRGHQEVLFGWGQHDDSTPGNVFSSTDGSVVREFDASFKGLCHGDVSVEVPLRSLLEDHNPAIVRHHGRSAGFEQRWDQDRCVDMWKRSQRNIRVFVSFFVDEVDDFGELTDILNDTRSPRTVEIMMLDPGPHDAPPSPVLECRYGSDWRLRKDKITAQDAKDHILGQLKRLEKIQEELDDCRSRGLAVGTLRVYLYDISPTIICYQSDDLAMMGVLLIHASGNYGPMIDVSSEEPLWTVLRENWNTVLLNRSRLVIGTPEDQRNFSDKRKRQEWCWF